MRMNKLKSNSEQNEAIMMGVPHVKNTLSALRDAITDHLLNILQRVKNAAARLITRSKKHDHKSLLELNNC